MAELNFIETSASEISAEILSQLENHVAEPLFPGDERRIFGEALAEVVVSVFNSVNDACRQKMLRYARGTVLDALGETRDVQRISASKASVTLRFGINEPITTNIIIPAGLRVTGDFIRYFLTNTTVVLPAGSLSVEVTATAEEGGESYNEIASGEINTIVDISEVPMLDYVTNTSVSFGGGDEETDEAYRERIREAENKLSTAGPVAAYRYWALSANPLVSDAVVESEKEEIVRTIQVYNGHAFIGGDTLLPETLEVYLPDGAKATDGTDYTVEYTDNLLDLTLLSEILESASSIEIRISRDMRGRVKIVPICAGGELPSADVLSDVLAMCSSDDVRPLTDYVTVESPSVEYYDIDLVYYTNTSDESKAVQNIEGSGGAIDQYVFWQGSKLGQDINPDHLRKLILSPDWDDELVGADRIDIIQPVYKELNSTTVAKFSGKLSVHHVVKE